MTTDFISYADITTNNKAQETAQAQSTAPPPSGAALHLRCAEQRAEFVSIVAKKLDKHEKNVLAYKEKLDKWMSGDLKGRYMWRYKGEKGGDKLRDKLNGEQYLVNVLQDKLEQAKATREYMGLLQCREAAAKAQDYKTQLDDAKRQHRDDVKAARKQASASARLNGANAADAHYAEEKRRLKAELDYWTERAFDASIA